MRFKHTRSCRHDCITDIILTLAVRWKHGSTYWCRVGKPCVYHSTCTCIFTVLHPNEIGRVSFSASTRAWCSSCKMTMYLYLVNTRSVFVSVETFNPATLRLCCRQWPVSELYTIIASICSSPLLLDDRWLWFYSFWPCVLVSFSLCVTTIGSPPPLASGKPSSVFRVLSSKMATARILHVQA